MSTPLTIRSYPSGPRVWVLGQRVHHGATGALLVAAGIVAACARRKRCRAIAALGLVLCAHDRADVRTWFRRAGLDSPADVL